MEVVKKFFKNDICIKQKYTGCRVRVWMISGFCGYGDSVGIPTGFSVGMGWVWALTFNPQGSPGILRGRPTTRNSCL